MEPVTTTAVIIGASIIVDIMLSIYNHWREYPDAGMAKHLKALQLEEVARKSRELDQEEAIHAEHAALRGKKMQELLETKQGLKEGWISPTELGIGGGGMSERDMPMVSAMAARLGMDPKDLVARFDPSRSNMYVPMSRRGAVPRGSARELALRATAKAPPVTPTGPAQLSPTTGFGG